MGKNKQDKLLKIFGAVCEELREITGELGDLNRSLESEIKSIQKLLRSKDAELYDLKKELYNIKSEQNRKKQKKNADITDVRRELYELIKLVDSVELD